MILMVLVCLSDPIFVDRAAQSGVLFSYRNGRTGQWAVPEEMGGGVALLDVDRDGDLDLYLVQADRPPLAEGGPGESDRLYLNESKGDKLKFIDATAAYQLKAFSYGMGVAVADVDADGLLDVYVTNFGPNQLWRNTGKGTFEDFSAASGTHDSSWSTSASFFHMDQDGLPDLYVANYVRYSQQLHKRCRNEAGVVDYCGPSSFEDATDRLYKNLGNGRFKDVTEEMGIQKGLGASLGVVAGDFDRNGSMDLFVACDADPNLLWLNRKGQPFLEDALVSGVALNHAGAKEAGMGIASGDVDGDGDEDLLLTHLRGETHTLYIQEEPLIYEDRTNRFGLGSTSLQATGFGTAFADVNSDGWLDLICVNGTVMTLRDQRNAGDPWPLRQANQLFLNQGGMQFRDESKRGGEGFQRLLVSRGLAVGDLDNDGDPDLVVTNNDGPVQVFQNMSPTRNWVGIIPVIGNNPHPQVGTKVSVQVGDRKLVRVSRRDGSYLSSSDPRLLFGLGSDAKIGHIWVTWPDGSKEKFPSLQPNRYHPLKKGRGEVVP